MNYENNIVYDSYYLISLFAEDQKEITQLQVQKLMYLFEAFYMIVMNVDNLYDCNFSAWTYGPVAIPLYNEYKNFGNNPIKLTPENEKAGNEIDTIKKRIIKKIYDVFGKLSAMELVNLTHMENSPWYKKWMENGEKIMYGAKSYIDKIETKNWFAENFLKHED